MPSMNLETPAPHLGPSGAPAVPAAPGVSVNGLAPEAVLAAAAAIAEDPTRAPVAFSAKSTWQGQLRSRTDVESYELGGHRIARRHTLHGDEPEELLGSNTAPNPQDLLLAALNSCMLVGFVVGATARGITLEHLSVESSLELDLRGVFGLDPSINPGAARVRYKVEIESRASPEELAELHAHVMATSPNRWHLAHPVAVDGELVLI